MKLTNLQKVINELNAPFELMGNMKESQFNFTIEENDGKIYIYDRNECYYIYYADDMLEMLGDIASEFEHEFDSTNYEDSVSKKLNDAIKKDFGEDAYIEWVDNVVMVIGQ
jgi:hypothetical protein